MLKELKIPLDKPQINHPLREPSAHYRAELIERAWGKSVIEPLPLYPHAVEFCRHYGKWWCENEKSRFAFVISVPEGKLRYRLDGRSITLEGNNVLIIPRRVKFRFETIDDTVYKKNVLYLLGVNVDEILETLNLSSMQPIKLSSLDFLNNSLKTIYDLLGEKTPQNMAEAAGTTFALLNYLAANIRQYEPKPQLLNILKSRFSNEFNSRIDLERTASEFGITSKTITRMFKKHLGLTPSEFRRNARNEYARRLLATTTLSIKEIADKLGYSSQFHFSKEFKQDNGAAPSEYRKS